MKKQIIYLIATLLIVTSSFTLAFADQHTDPEYRALPDEISFTRTSSSSGVITVTHYAADVATTLKATFSLQESALNSNSWSNSSAPDQQSIKRNSAYINAAKTFTITSQKKYRVKITFEDVIDSVKVTSIKYSNAI